MEITNLKITNIVFNFGDNDEISVSANGNTFDSEGNLFSSKQLFPELNGNTQTIIDIKNAMEASEKDKVL